MTPTAGTPTAGTAAPLPHPRHVLVPLDGSEASEAAVPTARALAQAFGARVQAVSVASREGDAAGLGRRAAAALGVAEGDESVHVVVGDDPAEAIGRRAAELEPCVVCMSSRGRGRVAGAVVGSTARAVLQTGREPMVVVGPHAERPDPYTLAGPPPLSVPRLVACVDGGPASESVLPVAAAWATALGMSLTILTVAEPSPPPVRPGTAWYRHHGPAEDADVYLERLLEAWKAAGPAVDTRVVYDPIGAADGVEDHLKTHPAGLVAVTTHARTGLRRALLGATAAEIVHRSVIPVLVVPLATDGGG